MEAQEKAFLEETAKEREAGLSKAFLVEDADKDVKNFKRFNVDAYGYGEIEQMMYYSDKAEDLARLIEDNDEELRAKLSNGDWLHIYASSIKDYAMDMGAAMRFSLKEGREGNPNDKMLADMQSIFGGNKSLTWDSLAEFSAYLSDLYDTGNEVTNAKGAKESYEVVSDYVVRQMEIVDAEDLHRSQSLYEMITHTKKNFG